MNTLLRKECGAKWPNATCPHLLTVVFMEDLVALGWASSLHSRPSSRGVGELGNIAGCLGNLVVGGREEREGGREGENNLTGILIGSFPHIYAYIIQCLLVNLDTGPSLLSWVAITQGRLHFFCESLR